MTKKCTLTFYRDEILYDINSIASIAADSLPEESPNHMQHLLQDITQGENRYRTMRYTNKAFYWCNNYIASLTKVPVSDVSTLDNTAGAPDAYEMYLTLEDDFSKGGIQLLKDAIHDYIVWYTWYQWVSLLYPDMAAVAQEKVAEAENQIQKSLDNGGKVGRIKPFPF